MKKDIYKITNTINGKCYIGQTTNAKRRFSEHKAKGYGIEPEKALYYAFEKYGIENFIFEVIEEQIENYNEREQYWIQYYDAYNNGYNMTLGGDEPPLHIKEDSPFATHTQVEVDYVIDQILNTNKELKKIAEETGYDYSAIKRIQAGTLWHDDNLDYPLRKETSRNYQEERALSIINDLLNTSLTQKQIAEKHNCARSTVTAINAGKNFKQENLVYPLRSKKDNTEIANKVKEALKNTTLTYAEISRLYNYNYNMIIDINRGRYYHDDTVEYPIRKNTN